TLPWTGHVCGLTENEPTVTLASYLSAKWLSTTHVNQCLDMLRWDLSRSTSDFDCEIVGPTFFARLRALFRTRETSPYGNNPGSRDIWAVGSDLAIGDRRSVGGIANVDNRHWIAVIINISASRILYGDSLGGKNVELLDAISWWIHSHTGTTLEHSSLPIASQADGYNCLIYANDALRHHYLSTPLLSGVQAAADA
ncbi:hypothetical protein FPV67DRAFT_1382418, partial [Lyophyllum atratum]